MTLDDDNNTTSSNYCSTDIENDEDGGVGGSSSDGSSTNSSRSSLSSSRWCCWSHLMLLVGTIVMIVLSTVNMTCFAILFVGDRFETESDANNNTDPLERVCRSFLDTFRLRRRATSSSSSSSLSWWQELEGLLVHGFAIPFFIVTVSTYLLVRRDSQLYLFPTRENNSSSPPPGFLRRLVGGICDGGGDPNVYAWVISFVLLPCLVVTFWHQLTVPTTIWIERSQRYDRTEWQSRLGFFASVTGDAAVMALSFFLVPVAKHSPLIHVFGLSFTKALVFHKVAGWISLVFTVFHTGLFLLDYGTGIFDSEIERIHEDIGFRAVLKEVIPPLRCWTFQAFGFGSTGWGEMSHNNVSTLIFNITNTTTTRTNRRCLWPTYVYSERQQLQQQQLEQQRSCNHYFFNFSGVLSAFAFVLLGIFSLPWVRRKAYWLFYTFHIPMAWIMMLGAIVHITYDTLFLLPNIIYYLAPTVAVWIQQFQSARRDKGVLVKSVTEIHDGGGCCLIRVQKPTSDDDDDDTEDDNQDRDFPTKSVLGGVCKICIPQISSIWHPFSTMKDRRTGDYLFLIRPTGGFSTSFLNQLTKCAPIGEEEREGSGEGSICANTIAEAASTTVVVPPIVLVDGLYPVEYRWHSTSMLHHDAVLLVAGGVGIVPFLPLLSDLYRSCCMGGDDDHISSGPQQVTLHWYCREEGLARYVCKEFLPWFLSDVETLDVPGDTAHHETAGEATVDDETRDNPMDTTTTTMTTAFDVFIHLTSNNGSDESTGDGYTSAFLSRMNLDGEVQNRTMDRVIKFVNHSSVPFQKANVSLTNNWKKNYIRGIWLGCLLGCCWVISWRYYQFETENGRGHPILLRVHTVTFCLVLSASFGTVLIWLSTKGYKHQNPYSSLATLSSSSMSCDMTTENHNDLSPNANRPASIRKRISIHPGRPRMDDVIHTVVTSNNPGAMFCGPEKLRSSVKMAIHKNIDKRACNEAVKKCAFYDEQSDM